MPSSEPANSYLQGRSFAAQFQAPRIEPRKAIDRDLILAAHVGRGFLLGGQHGGSFGTIGECTKRDTGQRLVTRWRGARDGRATRKR